MILDNQQFLIAKPSHQRGVGDEGYSTRSVFNTLDLDGRQVSQGLANLFRFLRIRLPLFR